MKPRNLDLEVSKLSRLLAVAVTRLGGTLEVTEKEIVADYQLKYEYEADKQKMTVTCRPITAPPHRFFMGDKVTMKTGLLNKDTCRPCQGEAIVPWPPVLGGGPTHHTCVESSGKVGRITAMDGAGQRYFVSWEEGPYSWEYGGDLVLDPSTKRE